MKRGMILVCSLILVCVGAGRLAPLSVKPEPREQISRLSAAQVSAVAKTLAPVSCPVAAVHKVLVPPAHPFVNAPKISELGARPSDHRRALVAGLGFSAMVAVAAQARAGTEVKLRDRFFYPSRTPAASVVLKIPRSVVPAPALGVPAAVGDALAPSAPAPTRDVRTPIDRPWVAYVDGQLSIEAHDASLSELLTQVAAVVGAKIDIPESASKRLAIVKLGPGPARQTLASLLNDASFDFIIVAPSAHPDGIQDVVLIPRGKTGSAGSGSESSERPPVGPLEKPTVTPFGSDEKPEDLHGP